MKSPLVKSNISPMALSQEITDFVTRRTEAVIERFLPDFVIPGFFCGHRRAGFSEAPDLIYLLGHLHTLGVSKICGVPMTAAIHKLLRCVDGPATTTFFSYRVAETLLAFGKFEGNALLEGFSDAERENIRIATDSTEVYDREKNALRGYLLNNFWAVLARCEFARQQLGILENDSVLQKSIAQLEHWLFQNPSGFFDDGREANGRYDIYSGDAHLFAEPIWHLLDGKKLETNLRQHVRLLEKIAMENGASFVYGRSIGALSICLLMEFISMSLERGLASDPTRSLALVAHALQAFVGWIEDDLINAHRHGNTESYRGIQRVLQMTFDCLGKLCYSAQKLRHAQPDASEQRERALFPKIDELIPFDSRSTSAVWMFRNEHLAFQLALVGGTNADYVPWLRSPGLLGNPVGAPMLCGVPRVARGALEYSVCGLPTKVEKSENSIVIAHENFPCVSDEKAPPLRGRRTASYRVEGDTIRWDEHLVFDQAPEALAFCIPETNRPLRLAVSSDQPFHQDVVRVAGMAEWRSCWGGFENLHQVQFTPAAEIRASFEITPKIRVRDVPATDHDYMRSLFGAMPAEFLIEKAWSQDIGMNVAAMSADVDIVHVSWPEHLFGQPTPREMEEFDARNCKFIEELGRSGVLIVWTMHNRRPHHWEEARGRRLYEAWAAIVDGVIHHSEWGMKLIRDELPFRPDAKHVVIPHGHFAERRVSIRSRKEIEASLGLPACAMRFGITGGWRKEKQIDLIMAAFSKAARPDQQLVVTAYTPETVKPDDTRIIFLPRGPYMTREEVTEYTHLCDALVSAHSGSVSYLTSGLGADAIGAGIPMLVPHWEYFHETLGDAPFYHENRVDSLAALFRSITEQDLQRGKAAFRALQPTYAWPALATKTLTFYRSLAKL
jgi:hypothetical protein